MAGLGERQVGRRIRKRVEELAALERCVVEAAVAEARYHGESRLRGCACDICAAADAYLAAKEGR